MRFGELHKVHRFPTGKVSSNTLRRIVFNRLGVTCDRLLQGPGVGEDAAVLDMGDKVIVVATDPITGAIGSIGWLVVHVNANDVASCGAKPLWFLCVAMLPEGAHDEVLEEIMVQMHKACCELGVSLIGGHTETTPGLNRPILVGFMVGEAHKDQYVTTGGAIPGDTVIMTKGAGIEGTAILAQDLAEFLKDHVDEEILYRSKTMLDLISVVPEAMMAIKVGGVHSLHDPTEGGVLNGIWEMTEAARVGVFIREEAVHVAHETRIICDTLGIDPLKLLGSGALLITVDPEKTQEIISALKKIGVYASIIGEIKPFDHGRTLLRKDGKRSKIQAVDQDHLYWVLDKLETSTEIT